MGGPAAAAAAMATNKDWMFCPTSGYLLHLDTRQGAAVCEVSGYRKQLAGGGRARVGSVGRGSPPASSTSRCRGHTYVLFVACGCCKPMFTRGGKGH